MDILIQVDFPKITQMDIKKRLTLQICYKHVNIKWRG